MSHSVRNAPTASAPAASLRERLTRTIWGELDVVEGFPGVVLELIEAEVRAFRLDLINRPPKTDFEGNPMGDIRVTYLARLERRFNTKNVERF